MTTMTPIRPTERADSGPPPGTRSRNGKEGDLGVVEERTVTPISAAQLGLPVEDGSFLLEITQRGVLAEAGLRPGDIILRLNGLTIDATMPYTNLLARLAPEEPVVVDVMSPNGARTVTVVPEVRHR